MGSMSLPDGSTYTLPEDALLGPGPDTRPFPRQRRDRRGSAECLRQVQRTGFTVTGYTRGPQVTRYEVHRGRGWRLASAGLERTSRLASDGPSATHSGKSAIGIRSPTATGRWSSSASALPGAQAVPQLVERQERRGKFAPAWPRPALVAGQTGSGKSSFISSMILDP